MTAESARALCMTLLLLLAAGCGDGASDPEPGNSGGVGGFVDADDGTGGPGGTGGTGGEADATSGGDETPDETGATGGGPGDPGDDPVEDAGPADDDPDVPGDSPEDVPEDDPPPELTIDVWITGDLAWARFGQELTFETEVGVNSETLTPDDVTVTLSTGASSLSEDFSDLGDGTGSFTQTVVGSAFPTTLVTVTATATAGDVDAEAEVTFGVLGNVWVADDYDDVVREYRTDGELMGQAIPSTFLDSPWTLFQIDAERMAVGNKYGGVEVFDLDGSHLYSFQTLDAEGQKIFGIWGGESIVRAPNGELWVGGVDGEIQRFDDDGVYLGRYEFPFYYQGVGVGHAEALSDGHVVFVTHASGAGIPDLMLITGEGELLTDVDYGKNPDVELHPNVLALAPDGKVLLGGRGATYTTGKTAILAQSGKWLDWSEAYLDVLPRWGLTAFGHDLLATTETDAVCWVNGDLELVDGDWTGEARSYSGLLVLGGHPSLGE